MTVRRTSDEDWEHVLKVWNKFKMKTMKDYHNLYLKGYILLLVHIFEKIRNSCLRNYTLFSSHYINVPSLSWDTMLEITKVEVGIISDVEMHLFFEKGMRGGVSYISKRYSTFNNKYLYL